MDLSRHDGKIVDCDVKPQPKQTKLNKWKESEMPWSVDFCNASGARDTQFDPHGRQGKFGISFMPFARMS